MSILNTLKSFFAPKPPVTKTYITVKDLDGHTIQIPHENLDQFNHDLATERRRREHDKQHAEQVAREEEQRAREAAARIPVGTVRKDN